MKILNKFNKGTILKITVEGNKFILHSSKTNNKMDITDLLTEDERKGLKRVGRGLGVVLNQEEIAVCFYCNYHTHSEFSILDGMSKIKDIAKKSSGVTAITDHGNMFAMLEFQKAMEKEGKKAIIGTEAYVESVLNGEKKGNHLILLAKNEQGKKNLFELSSNSYENFYRKPHVSVEDLKKYHEGIICTSACIAGEVSQLLINGDKEGAKKVALFYKELFGEDYYIEVQRHKIIKEQKIEKDLLNLAKELGIKVVAGNDSHYLNEEDAPFHEVLLNISVKKTLNDADKFSFDGEGYYYKSDMEMLKDFWDMPEVIANTLEIAEKCDLVIETGVYHTPAFPLPDGFENDVKYFEKIVYDGYKKRFGISPEEDNDKRILRLCEEMQTIARMGYCSYFLIVWDFINWAKENGVVVGPARGSAGGSLVAYCMGITEINPLKYDLLFERFLNPERVSMPDIDTDFDYINRQRVIDYCRQKYGNESVCNIVTFGSLKAKYSVRDTVRTLGYEYALGDMISKLIGDNKSLKEALDNVSELSDLYNSDMQVKNVLDTALRIENNKRNTSTHACGVVISDKPVKNYCPTSLIIDDKKETKVLTSQLTMTEVEELGLLKMDFLGLRTLNAIGDTIKDIKDLRSKEGLKEINNYNQIPLNDPYAYLEISKGISYTVFQLESEGMRSFLVDLYSDVPEKIKSIENKQHVTNGEYVFNRRGDEEFCKEMEEFGDELFERLIAGVSLYRPGPMDYIPEYIRNMKNPETITYDTPLLEPILKSTYGVIVYQEQVMNIVRTLAGFSMGQADVIRKAMGKKKEDLLEEYKPYFLHGSGEAVDSHTGQKLDIKGCLANGISEEVANAIWDKMKDFAKYAFNKSHATAYAFLSIVCGWLNHYYGDYYMTETLNAYIDDNEHFKKYIAVSHKLGYTMVVPSINNAKATFSVAGKKKINFGLLGVKNLNKSVSAILKNRENEDYSGLVDFIEKNYDKGVSKSATASLVNTGFFDSFPYSRKAKALSIDRIYANAKKEDKGNISGQLSFLDSVFVEASKDSAIEDIKEYEKDELLNLEKECTGLYLTEHPLDRYDNILKSINTSEISFLTDEDGNVFTGKVTLAGIIENAKIVYSKNTGKPFATFKLEDRAETISAVIFNTQYEAFKELIANDKIVIIKGEVKNDVNYGMQIICDSVMDIDKIPNIAVTKAYIKVNSTEQFKDIDSIVSSYKGETPLYVQVENQLYKFNKSVNPSSSLVLALQKYCGENFVKIV